MPKRPVNQANQNDWPKETWTKYPIKVIETATRMQLSDSFHLMVYPHVLCFFPSLNTYFTFFTTSFFGEVLFCKAKGFHLTLSLVTDHWSSG